MGRNVTLDFSAGGGSDTEFLIGTITLEPTAVHEIGNRVVLPAPRSTGINAGVGVLEDVAISPAGPEPAWAYRATVRDSISGKAQTWLVGVPTGTTAIPFNQLTKFTTTIPPQTTAGMMQNWADTTEANADRSELAADRAEAPTDLMNKNLIENPASLTAGALSEAFVGRSGTRGATRTLYVRSTGSDTNDGKTAATAFREIRAAVDSLDAEMPALRGSVLIDVGAGTYKGGSRLPNTRTPTQDAFLTIKGPPVGGHPNKPTAIISFNADTAATWGILAENGWWLWVEDIQITGAFGTGLDCRSDVTLQRRNVHIDGPAIGVNVTTRVMDNARGGIVENCTSYGVQEMYHVVRTYAGGPGLSTIYRNNKFGIYSKVHCGGHLDDAVFENNQVALHLDRSSANVGGVSISGSAICGISLKDSEIHGGVTWGAGNARRVLTYGPSSSESEVWGWINDPQATLRTGITPPICIANQYTPATVTGTTTATTLANFLEILRADRYAVQGRRVKVRIVGTAPATLAGQMLIRIQVASSTVLAIVIPAGTTGGAVVIDAEMVCTADGNNQLWSATHMTQNGSFRAYQAATTSNLTDADRSVTVQVQAGDVADSFTANAVEVYG